MKILNFSILLFVLSVVSLPARPSVNNPTGNGNIEATAALLLSQMGGKTSLSAEQQSILKDSLFSYITAREQVFAQAVSEGREVDFSRLEELYLAYRQTEKSILDIGQLRDLYGQEETAGSGNGISPLSASITPLASGWHENENILYRPTIQVPQTVSMPYYHDVDRPVVYYVDFGDKSFVHVSWEIDLMYGDDYVEIYAVSNKDSWFGCLKEIRGVSSGKLSGTVANGRLLIYISSRRIDGGTINHAPLKFTFTKTSMVDNNLNVTGTAYFSGNVGVKTSSPTEALEVKGNIKATKLLTTGDIQVGTTAASYGSYGKKLYFGDPLENTDPFYIARYNVSQDVSELRVNLGDDQMDKFVVGSELYYASGFTTVLTALMKERRVGIATNDPQSTLDVRGTTLTEQLTVQNPLGYLQLTLPGSSYASLTTDLPYFYFNKPIRFSSGQFGSYGSDNLQLQTNGATQMTVLHSNGNIGIGTPAPEYKLDVNGTIRADEVLITSEGADFVFEEGYRLPSLQEVEQHILENKHLPDIPSAAEMKEKGVGMADLQVRLLQKIEELTLYVISQQKLIDELMQERVEQKNNR